MPEGDVKAAELHHLSVRAGDSNADVSINFSDVPRFATETERKDWQSRQIAVHTTALIGDARFGVVGLVDRVNAQHTWLIVLTVLTALICIVLVYLLFQVSQINAVLHQLQQLIQRLP